MTQTPITIEQLKHPLQLQRAGVEIPEITHRLSIRRNGVSRYLFLLTGDSKEERDNQIIQITKYLAEKAYRNDSMVHDMHCSEKLAIHFKYAQGELVKVGVKLGYMSPQDFGEFLNKQNIAA